MNIEKPAAAIRSFEEFLAPLDANIFFRDYFGERPIHIRTGSQRLSSLLTWDDLNRILSCELDTPNFRLMKESKPVAKEKFLAEHHAWVSHFLLLDPAAISRELDQGATIIVNQFEQKHRPVSDVARVLELALGNYVDVVVFASCRPTRGFNTHWDREDVFIAQVAGRKHWRLFENERRYPTRDDRMRAGEPPRGAPYWEGDLTPGDVLYIPNGWWHDAAAVDGPTLHISFGCEPQTGIDLAEQLLARLDNCEELRRNLLRFKTQEERANYMSTFRRLIRETLEEVDPDAFFAGRDSTAHTRGALSLPWSALPDPQTYPLPPSSWIHWLPPRHLPLREADGKLMFEARGSTYSFAAVAAPILKDLMECRKTRVDTLYARHPRIAEAAVDQFVIRLIVSGLVSLTNDGIL